MRLCRIQRDNGAVVAFYQDSDVISLDAALAAYANSTGDTLPIVSNGDLLRHLPHGDLYDATKQLGTWLATGTQDHELIEFPDGETEKV